MLLHSNVHRCISRAHCHGLGHTEQRRFLGLRLLLHQRIETFSRLTPHCLLLGTPKSHCSGSLFKIQGSCLSSKSLKLQRLALTDLVEVLLDTDMQKLWNGIGCLIPQLWVQKDQRICSLLASQMSRISGLQKFSERLPPQNVESREGRQQILASDLHTHSHARRWTQRNTCIHTPHTYLSHTQSSPETKALGNNQRQFSVWGVGKGSLQKVQSSSSVILAPASRDEASQVAYCPGDIRPMSW